MANVEQLTILSQGVRAWNEWRKAHPDIKIDLRGAELDGVKLDGASLRRAFLSGTKFDGASLRRAFLAGAFLNEASLGEANLSGANLSEAFLEEANLNGTNLNGAFLNGAFLRRANLEGAFLNEAFLSGTNLSGANLRGANLRGANLEEALLEEANLIRANLSGATLTGACLYGTSRDDWKVDGITCDYVYWDASRNERTPKDRGFRPGEFEKLYTQLPTFIHIFEHGFTPLVPLVMDQVVQVINRQHSEFDLKLATFDVQEKPHATFTVCQTEFLEPAQQQVTTGYERRLTMLKDQQDQIVEVLERLVSGASIHIVEENDGIQIIGGNVDSNIVE
jgi:uncharacterized protein YjbI with pentapeptide repeats